MCSFFFLVSCIDSIYSTLPNNYFKCFSINLVRWAPKYSWKRFFPYLSCAAVTIRHLELGRGTLLQLSSSHDSEVQLAQW